jgi:hypothetical protein
MLCLLSADAHTSPNQWIHYFSSTENRYISTALFLYEQSRMNNPEKQAGAIKNEQSRETGRSNQE